MSQDLGPSDSSRQPVTPARGGHGHSFSESLQALVRLQILYYRLVPLTEFPVLTLAPDSTHKYDDGRRGGNFEIQPVFIRNRGGIIFRHPEGEYHGMFVDEEQTTLAIERLYPHDDTGESVVLKSRPEKSPVIVSLVKPEAKRYPVGKDLRIVVVLQNGKTTVHFYNKSQIPMEVGLFQAEQVPATGEEVSYTGRRRRPAQRTRRGRLAREGYGI